MILYPKLSSCAGQVLRIHRLNLDFADCSDHCKLFEPRRDMRESAVRVCALPRKCTVQFH